MNIAKRLMFPIAIGTFGGLVAAAQPHGEPTRSIPEVRILAGESQFIPTAAGDASWESIAVAATSPDLEFPIRLVPERSSGALGYRVIVPPATPAGNYIVHFRGQNAAGTSATESVKVTVEPLLVGRAASGRPPVVLLNGWQFSCPANPDSSTPASADTFGQLYKLLQADGASVVFFNNCAVGDYSIEVLASSFNNYLAGLHYTDGSPVTQVDLVAHSMGGLIVRAYLAGLQSGGSFAPPANTRVRKLIEIATPNFGSFLAPNVGVQTSEMFPGSTFLWTLGTWNQGGDDLRGVDAIAVAGNGGYAPLLGGPPANASDGVVSITSASLGFARDASRTRVLPYCHTESSLIDCNGSGIANVDHAPETGRIVRSFLADGTDWTGIGVAATQDPYLSQYGGIYFAVANATGQFSSDLTQVKWGSVALQNGGASHAVYFGDLIKGTGTFQFTSTSLGTATCGSFTSVPAYYGLIRCKYPPVISSVRPLLANAASRTIVAGGNITVSGNGFGTQCSSCGIWAYPGPVQLQVASWADQAITAFLPASFNGYTQIVVRSAAGTDMVGAMATPMASSLSLSSTQLQFAYTLGGSAPAAQSVSITSSTGTSLSWSASSTAGWLILGSQSGTTPATLTISVNTAGLTPGPYAGTITVTAAGASNSPQQVSVNLMVAGQPPSISLSNTRATFAYTVNGTVSLPQQIGITNAGGGTLTWSASSAANWVSISPASGTAPSNLIIGVVPNGLQPGPYSAAVTITANGATNSPQAITVTLTVSAAAPSVIVTSVTNSASSVAGSIAPGEIITVKGTGLGPATGVSLTIDPATSLVSSTLAGTRVLIGGYAAPITYTSAGQINAIVPYELAGQSQATMQVQYQSATSAATTLQITSVAPAAFTLNATGAGQAAALNQDGSLNAPSNPAPKSSYVSVYFTGGGLTNPPGMTGSVNGSVLKWLAGNTTVTVGGQPTTVAFIGAAPGLVDGADQLNILISDNIPSGAAQPVVITIGGIQSPSTATIAIQ